MSRGRRTAGTIGDRLVSRRRRGFVGRAAEVELFRSLLDEPEPSCSVLHVYGPGGVGKSSLLEVLAAEAGGRGAVVVRLDGRDLAPTPESVLSALAGHLDVPETGPVRCPDGRVVLLVDSCERLAAVDGWLRDGLLPRLPGDALTVLAGRDPPGTGWRADPAWRELLRVVSLRNLSREEAREYLLRCGVEEHLHRRLLDLTYGHPLALSLVTDVVARGGVEALDPAVPDVVATLLQRLVDAVPDERRRRALEVCALARVTTEDLLRHALAVPDAHEAFAWLRELSFVDSGPEGLFPHDLARDVLDVDLRWRDPEGYARVFRRVRAHIHHSLRSSAGHEQQRAVFDEKFLFRNLPGIMSPVDWESWGGHYPEPARAADRPALLDVVAAAEGEESAALAERWLDRQPEAFVVLRERSGEVRGLLAMLDLTSAAAEDRAADPGAAAAWHHAETHAPARPGEVVTLTRFVVDRGAYQGPSPTLNAVPVLTLQAYLRLPDLAWDFLALAEPEPWDEYFAFIDLPRAAGADFVVGPRRYGLFGHDFRAVPVDDLMELWTERALAQERVAPEPRRTEPLVLSQADFAAAVRQALHDLRRPDLLGRSPLLRTRVLRERCSVDPGPADLAGLLQEAARCLEQDPRDDKLLRAVARTYFHPARTQEAAAAALGLPFSTYRRHLTQGVSRVVAWCWEREVYGAPRG